MFIKILNTVTNVNLTTHLESYFSRNPAAMYDRISLPIIKSKANIIKEIFTFKYTY